MTINPPRAPRHGERPGEGPEAGGRGRGPEERARAHRRFPLGAPKGRRDMKKPREPKGFPGPKWLPDKDSNLNKQSQNLLCYHYTIGQ